MKSQIGSEALIPNLTLAPFNVLIGEWQTRGTHPYVSTALHGRTSFEWIEGGAFLLMRSEINEPNFPSGVAVIGSDDVAKEFFMLYFDERGVSRKHDVAVTENKITWWRDNPEFSQRFTINTEDPKRLVGVGEMSKDGGAWENDLSLIFTKHQF